MTMQELIRSQIAEIEGDVPKWMLEALDISKTNETEMASLQAKLETANSDLAAVTEQLREAQAANIKSAEEQGQVEVEFENDQEDGELSVDEVLERGVELTL